MENQIRKPDPVTITSADINEERMTQLRQLFPEAFTEGKVDFDKLRATLGNLVDDRPERYSFTWAGKQDAIRILQTPTSATLIPAPDESVDFNNTQNIFIEGDNLEVLKLLYKSYFGRVKMIYIDPPYNTGNDFIYPDNYADPLDAYLQITGQKDAEGNLLTTNSDTSGRYHSAWLTMMYPRLFVARQLLNEDGVIFVSIDDKELHNLKQLMNEIFGEENYFATIIVQANKRGQTYKQISKTHEYVLVYTKNDQVEVNELEKSGNKDDLNLEDSISRFNIRELRNRNPKFGRHNRPNLFYPIYVNPDLADKDGFCPVSISKKEGFFVEVFPFNSQEGESCWRWEKKKVIKSSSSKTLVSDIVARKKNSGEFGIYEKYRKTTYKAKSIWFETDVITEKGTVELRKLGLADQFDFPKPVFLLKKILMLGADEEGLVLDFFSGSATLAQAVLELNREDGGNRKLIAVQLPKPIEKPLFNNLADVGKERIRRVIQQMKAEDEDKLPLETRDTPEDLGFKVFKLAPTNFRAWEGTAEATPEEFASQMELFTDPLVDGWRPANVIYEIALKEGYSLNCYIQRTVVAGHEVYRVNDQEKDQHFYLCLENAITENLPAKLNLSPDDLFICRDISLDDTMAANLALQCRLKTI